MTVAHSPAAILLTSAPDQPGLVAAVTQFIYVNGGNILDLEQHVDAPHGLFFMRVEWSLEHFAIRRDHLAERFAPIATGLRMAWQLHFSDQRPRLAIFVSRHVHCFFDLLARWQSGEFAAEIPLIVSNHGHLANAAAAFGIPFHEIPVTPANKSAAEAEQLALLARQRIDLIVLARYMQVLSSDFVAAYPGAIINVHHSSLPAFPGARPYLQAFNRGVKIIGATSHYATGDLDQGPIIAQDVTRIDHRDSVADLIRKGRDLENTVLARAIHSHLQHRILVHGNKTIVFG